MKNYNSEVPAPPEDKPLETSLNVVRIHYNIMLF